MKLKLEDGGTYVPKNSDPVFCEEHNFTAIWGDLSGIQQLAVSEGFDIIGGSCILQPERGASRPRQY